MPKFQHKLWKTRSSDLCSVVFGYKWKSEWRFTRSYLESVTLFSYYCLPGYLFLTNQSFSNPQQVIWLHIIVICKLFTVYQNMLICLTLKKNSYFTQVLIFLFNKWSNITQQFFAPVCTNESFLKSPPSF